MKFEHQLIPEGISVTAVHPLKELLVLLSGAVILIASVDSMQKKPQLSDMACFISVLLVCLMAG